MYVSAIDLKHFKNVHREATGLHVYYTCNLLLRVRNENIRKHSNIGVGM